MAKRRLWLGRRKDYPEYVVIEGQDCPESIEFGRVDGCFIKSFCTFDFSRITGIRLKPGEVREIQSISIKLKPKAKRGKK